MSVDTTNAAELRAILHLHEIRDISINPAPRGGWWIAICQCQCGHSSPPEHRADHLAQVLDRAGVSSTGFGGPT